MSRLAAFFTASLFLSLAACADEETLQQQPPVPSFEGTLDLEIRGTAAVSLRSTGPTDTTVSLTITNAAAPHLLDDGAKLEGPGTLEQLPESASELYVAKLSLPADPAGPCADQPRAIALSLHHRLGTPRFAGGLAIYCGTEPRGTPTRILRLSGTLEPH